MNWLFYLMTPIHEIGHILAALFTFGYGYFTAFNECKIIGGFKPFVHIMGYETEIIFAYFLGLLLIRKKHPNIALMVTLPMLFHTLSYTAWQADVGPELLPVAMTIWYASGILAGLDLVRRKILFPIEEEKTKQAVAAKANPDRRQTPALSSASGPHRPRSCTQHIQSTRGCPVRSAAADRLRPAGFLKI